MTSKFGIMDSCCPDSTFYSSLSYSIVHGQTYLCSTRQYAFHYRVRCCRGDRDGGRLHPVSLRNGRGGRRSRGVSDRSADVVASLRLTQLLLAPTGLAYNDGRAAAVDDVGRRRRRRRRVLVSAVDRRSVVDARSVPTLSKATQLYMSHDLKHTWCSDPKRSSLEVHEVIFLLSLLFFCSWSTQGCYFQSHFRSVANYRLRRFRFCNWYWHHNSPFFERLKKSSWELQFSQLCESKYPPITCYWTVPLILDRSYLVRKLTSSKIADTKVSGFKRF